MSRYLLSKALPDDPLRSKIIKQLGPHLFQEQDVFKIRTENNDLIILPRSLANAAIDNAHGTLLTGHGGIDKTVARIRQLYYWPSLIVDVKQRLKECLRCQKALRSAPMAENLHPLPLCSAPNQRIHCDLFGPLKTVDNSKAHVLCITDAYTKYSELCVVHNKEAQTIASAIISNWICRFGIPDQIFSDGGKEFANKLLKYICEFLKIAKNKITPAHPQGNAQVEIVNKSIKKYLTTMTENALDWIPLVPTLAFAYNTTCHSTTGFSPAHLMFGFQPKYSTNMSLPQTTSGPIDGLLRHMFLNRQVANKNSLENTEAYRKRHDEHLENEKVTPGQFIFLDRRIFLNTNEKLEDKWEGPFLVLKTFSNGTVDILRKGRSIRVNKSRIKRFTAMGDIKSDYIPQLAPELHDNLDKDTPNTLTNTNDSSDTNDFSHPNDISNSSFPNPSLSNTPGKQLWSPTTPSSRRTRGGATPFSSPILQPCPMPPLSDTDSDNEELPDADLSPTQADYQPPPQVAKQTSRFGPHPMILRQRKSRPTVSHLRIASLVATNTSQVVRLNKKIIRKFAEHINNIASLHVLDEFALPKKVKSASVAAQCNRRREYLKSLTPAKRNTLLTGDPLFAFDPITYEYVWATSRPPLEAEELELFEHLPHVPDFPGGRLVHIPHHSPPQIPHNPQPHQPPPPPPQPPSFQTPFYQTPQLPPRPQSAPHFNIPPQPPPAPPPHPIAPFRNPQPPPYIPVVPQPGSIPYRPPFRSQSPVVPQNTPPPQQPPIFRQPLPPITNFLSNHNHHPQPFAQHFAPGPVFRISPPQPFPTPPRHQPAPIDTSFRNPLPVDTSYTNPLPLDTTYANPLPVETSYTNPLPLQHLPAPEDPPQRLPIWTQQHPLPPLNPFPIQIHLPERPRSQPHPEPFRITHGVFPRNVQYSAQHPTVITEFPQPQHSLLYRPDPPDIRMDSLPYLPSPPTSPAMSTRSCPDPSQLVRIPTNASNLTMLSHMSRNTTSSSSTTSMNSRMYDTSRTPSPPIIDPMLPDRHIPFRQPPGPQFEDLNARFLPTPLPYEPPHSHSRVFTVPRPSALPPQQANSEAFNRFRDSRNTINYDVPPAPRYVDAYGNPFNQWPPATQQQVRMPPSRGTFDGLTLNDHPHAIPQPHTNSPPPMYQPYPQPHQPHAQPAVTHQAHPALAYNPLNPTPIAAPQAIALPDLSAQHPAFELVPYQPGAQIQPNSYVLRPRPIVNPAQISPPSSGPPSIDTLDISVINTLEQNPHAPAATAYFIFPGLFLGGRSSEPF